MNQPPLWLSYVAPFSAVVAVCISLLSLVVAAKSFRRSGANVVVEYTAGGVAEVGRPGVLEPAVEVRAMNRGMAATTIDELAIWPSSVIGRIRSGPYVLPDVAGEWSLLEGPEMPFRLEAQSSTAWTYAVLAVGSGQAESSDGDISPDQIWQALRRSAVAVNLGDGRTKWVRTIHLGPPIVIGEFDHSVAEIQPVAGTRRYLSGLIHKWRVGRVRDR